MSRSKPLRSRPIQISLIAGQLIMRLILFPNGNCQLDWNSNVMLYARGSQTFFNCVPFRLICMYGVPLKNNAA